MHTPSPTALFRTGIRFIVIMQEEELEHIYSLLRASATQPAMTTDDVPSATHRESPLVASAAANGPGNKSVTWDEASMTVAMEMERTKDKKKKPKFWKVRFAHTHTYTPLLMWSN